MYSQCYSNLGSRMFIDQIINKPQKLALIGPPCSTDAPNIAEVAHYWNLISVIIPNKNTTQRIC